MLSDALRGVRVIDLTRNFAGPFCTMLLADLGADVIKVERPGAGDDTREWRPPEWNGHSASYLSANRNKRSITVDMDTDHGREVIRRLAETADVLVESFRPGSLQARGLDAESLRSLNPRLIYCSISAYGQQGPKSHLPGYDPVLQAATGILDNTGYPDEPAARVGVGAIDLGSSLWAAIGIQAALREREQTGEGAHVQASLFETATWWMSYHLAGYLASGQPPQRAGTATSFIAPYETFPTADGDILIAGANTGIFVALVTELGLTGLAHDARFASNADRVAHRGELRALLLEALSQRTAEEWEQALTARGVPCSRVRNVSELVTDPQLEAIGLLENHPHPDIPDLRLVGLPISVDGLRGAKTHAPPRLGEHTDEVLAELGLI